MSKIAYKKMRETLDELHAGIHNEAWNKHFVNRLDKVSKFMSKYSFFIRGVDRAIVMQYLEAARQLHLLTQDFLEMKRKKDKLKSPHGTAELDVDVIEGYEKIRSAAEKVDQTWKEVTARFSLKSKKIWSK